MEWSSFVGATAGSAIGMLVVLGGVLIVEEIGHRKSSRSGPSKPASLDNILESQLEEHIVRHFETLFPGWRIYALNVNADGSAYEGRPKGIRYRTDAGEIDILCLDAEDNLVVVELKRDKAPDKVVAQTDRYIAWVEKTLAQPNQKVWGLIIARSLNTHLMYTLSKRTNIKFWAYKWLLEFDKSSR